MGDWQKQQATCRSTYQDKANDGVLDSAQSVPQDFEFFRSWKIHPLKGNLKGYWSLTVKENWRIIFRFDGKHTFDIDYLDYR